MTTRKTGGKTSKKKPALKLKMSRRGGGMTVQEAGRLGGLIGGRKGGLTVKRERGVAFYQEIGKLGGERVRALIAAGKKATSKQRSRGARR
jgi:hypothetical protein